MEKQHEGGPRGPWRVEWRADGRAEVVARLDEGAFPHHSALEPWVGRLRGEGYREGELVLVAEAGGAVVARRRLDRPPAHRTRPPARRARPRARRPGGPPPLAADEGAG